MPGRTGHRYRAPVARGNVGDHVVVDDLLVVTEASERGSFAMTLAANLTRFAFGSLKSSPRVLGSPNWIVPGAEMETSYFPQADDIIEIVTSQFHPEKPSNRRGIRTWDDRDLARKGL